MATDMTKGSPLKIILSFSVPVLFGFMFQQLYSVIDTIIVSKILGDKALAAVGSIGSVNFLILGFCNGIAGGFAIPVAQSFGAGDIKKLKRLVGNTVLLFSFFALIFTVFPALLCRKILIWTNTPTDILEMAYDYLFVIFLGIPFMFAYNTLNSMIRSLGDSRSPLFVLIASSFINILLDLFLIIVLQMGTMGAAIATVIAQICSVIGCLWIIVKKQNLLHISRDDLLPDSTCICELLKTGIPMGLQVSITGIGSVLLQTAVNGLGSMAVAAVTAAERISNLLCIVTISIGNALSVFCGQNLGAQKIDRIRHGVWMSVKIVMIFSAAVLLGIAFFGKYLVLIFIDAQSTELIDMTFRYIFCIACFFWSAALIHTVRFAIQGLGNGKIVLAASVLEMTARGIAGILLVPHFGFYGACFSSPLAWLMADLFLIPAFFALMKKIQRSINN